MLSKPAKNNALKLKHVTALYEFLKDSERSQTVNKSEFEKFKNLADDFYKILCNIYFDRNAFIKPLETKLAKFVNQIDHVLLPMVTSEENQEANMKNATQLKTTAIYLLESFSNGKKDLHREIKKQKEKGFNLVDRLDEINGKTSPLKKLAEAATSSTVEAPIEIPLMKSFPLNNSIENETAVFETRIKDLQSLAQSIQKNIESSNFQLATQEMKHFANLYAGISSYLVVDGKELASRCRKVDKITDLLLEAMYIKLRNLKLLVNFQIDENKRKQLKQELTACLVLANPNFMKFAPAPLHCVYYLESGVDLIKIYLEKHFTTQSTIILPQGKTTTYLALAKETTSTFLKIALSLKTNNKVEKWQKNAVRDEDVENALIEVSEVMKEYIFEFPEKQTTVNSIEQTKQSLLIINSKIELGNLLIDCIIHLTTHFIKDNSPLSAELFSLKADIEAKLKSLTHTETELSLLLKSQEQGISEVEAIVEEVEVSNKTPATEVKKMSLAFLVDTNPTENDIAPATEVKKMSLAFLVDINPTENDIAPPSQSNKANLFFLLNNNNEKKEAAKRKNSESDIETSDSEDQKEGKRLKQNK